VGADQGEANLAPATLSAGSVKGTKIDAGRLWTRISRLGPKYFSNDPDVRFATPGIPGGCLYLGEDSVTCFWEVFNGTITGVGTELRISKTKITDRKIHLGKLKRTIEVFDVANAANMVRIGANVVGCFNGSYKIARGWAELLYKSHPTLDGIRFPSARAGGGTNLALFGGRVQPADIEFKPDATDLLADPDIARLMLTVDIGQI
jgi:hypothetical protein